MSRQGSEVRERVRLLGAAPDRTALRRMARAVGGRSASVGRVLTLHGGVDSSTHAVEILPLGWVVVKQSWVAGPRHLAEEGERLEIAHCAPVPTPELVAVDLEGTWFGRPALVMSRLPGRARIHASADSSWLAPLAENLAAVHATVLPTVLPSSLLADHAWKVWQPASPEELRPTPRIRAIHAAARSLQHDLWSDPPATVLCHHDFHARNVTWHRGQLAGVVDWNEARLGPATADVAYCSVDLAMVHGQRAATVFVAWYRQAGAAELRDLDRWQLLWIANALRWTRYFQASFGTLGLELSISQIRRRLTTFADRILREG